MTLFLLILIAVMTLVTMVCAVIDTIILVKDKKANELVKKALGITSIVLLVALVIGASVGVSHMDKGKGSTKTTTTEESSDSSQTALEQAGFNKVSIDEYLELIKSSDKQIILIARPTCGFCEKFTPILNVLGTHKSFLSGSSSGSLNVYPDNTNGLRTLKDKRMFCTETFFKKFFGTL